MPENEILRLRDHFHELAGNVTKHEYGLRDQARGLGELRDELREQQRLQLQLSRKVDAMTEEERLAHGIADALQAQRHERFGFWHKVIAGAAALILLVPALHDLVSWIPH